MNDNQIDNWADLDELKNAKGLETVYLERNPLQKDPQYRRKIMLALPSVKQIDATYIRFWSSTSLCPPSPKPSTVIINAPLPCYPYGHRLPYLSILFT